jgi:ribosome-associated toxin RatA of RatAB toxin-antitoxin module
VRSSISISIRASAGLVFNLVSDVERWPRLLPHYERVTVRERREGGALVAEFVARRPVVPILGLGLPVAWRSLTWNEPDGRRLRFTHLAGATRGMDVTWRIEPREDGCSVTIEHEFRPRVAPWATLVDRAFVRPIAGRTLATFKAIAEAVAEAVAPRPAPKPERT